MPGRAVPVHVPAHAVTKPSSFPAEWLRAEPNLRSAVGVTASAARLPRRNESRDVLKCVLARPIRTLLTTTEARRS